MCVYIFKLSLIFTGSEFKSLFFLNAPPPSLCCLLVVDGAGRVKRSTISPTHTGAGNDEPDSRATLPCKVIGTYWLHTDTHCR